MITESVLTIGLPYGIIHGKPPLVNVFVAQCPRGGDDQVVIAVLGLGEAGSAIALDLVRAGVRVLGWDPNVRGDLREIPLAESDQSAVAEADVVLSVNSAAVALDVATRLAPFLRTGKLFADLNTSSPRLKEAIARVIEAHGALFADVALMAPVPGRGLRTPALVSGSGAEQFVAIFAPLGMPVQSVGPRPGAAARQKLLRSVFMKGLAAVVLESLAAAERVGCREWMWKEIARELTEADESLLRRLVEGSYRHAARRIEEMRAAAELLKEVQTPPHVTMASLEWLKGLARTAEGSGEG